MRRRTFDTMMSIAGLLVAAVLIVAGGLLTWGHNYITDEVHDQLAAQKIFFPAADSPAVAGSQYAQMRQYGGQQLLTGAQAKTYADHFIAVHLAKSGGGLTYSELSAKSQANPDNKELAAQVQTQFRGETLRGLLLNAYAFGTMGRIAGLAAIAAFVGGGLMLILSVLGLYHARKTPPDAEILAD